MIRSRRVLTVAATGCAALVLAACGGASSDTPSGASGEPVAGGTARVVQITEPRTLDPATLGNQWVLSAFLGNALFGTLMINDPESGEIQYKMAESLTSSDGGATFELKLRPGLKFSDGSPLDAEAVKFNWERIKNPDVGSQYLAEASTIASSEVVDATTLKLTMAEPLPNFAETIYGTSLNWIASPKALEAGSQKFDADPVGAGPFTLQKWTRQDVIELVKNPGYFDAPKPYLDAITLRSNSDTAQRLNTLTSGGADVAIETNWASVAKAKDAGFPTDTVTLNGGTNLTMNTRRAPFEDVRARKAVAAALDLDAINLAVYEGKAQMPRTLFLESSPFYRDLELAKPDRETAQRLFDELAAEGKPVSFTFTSGPTTEIRGFAESVQAQLSAFKNVDVKVKVVDMTEVLKLRRTNDFDMTVSSAHFGDPEPTFWTVFHGKSGRNFSGIDDAELSAALQTGRTATTVQERKAAYDKAQQRLIDLVPAIFLIRSGPSVVTGKNVGGVVQYGYGSLLPEELWLAK